MDRVIKRRKRHSYESNMAKCPMESSDTRAAAESKRQTCANTTQNL